MQKTQRSPLIPKEDEEVRMEKQRRYYAGVRRSLWLADTQPLRPPKQRHHDVLAEKISRSILVDHVKAGGSPISGEEYESLKGRVMELVLTNKTVTDKQIRTLRRQFFGSRVPQRTAVSNNALSSASDGVDARTSPREQDRCPPITNATMVSGAQQPECSSQPHSTLDIEPRQMRLIRLERKKNNKWTNQVNNELVSYREEIVSRRRQDAARQVALRSMLEEQMQESRLRKEQERRARQDQEDVIKREMEETKREQQRLRKENEEKQSRLAADRAKQFDAVQQRRAKERAEEVHWQERLNKLAIDEEKRARDEEASRRLKARLSSKVAAEVNDELRARKMELQEKEHDETRRRMNDFHDTMAKEEHRRKEHADDILKKQRAFYDRAQGLVLTDFKAKQHEQLIQSEREQEKQKRREELQVKAALRVRDEERQELRNALERQVREREDKKRLERLEAAREAAEAMEAERRVVDEERRLAREGRMNRQRKLREDLEAQMASDVNRLLSQDD